MVNWKPSIRYHDIQFSPTTGTTWSRLFADVLTKLVSSELRPRCSKLNSIVLIMIASREEEYATACRHRDPASSIRNHRHCDVRKHIHAVFWHTYVHSMSRTRSFANGGAVEGPVKRTTGPNLSRLALILPSTPGVFAVSCVFGPVLPISEQYWVTCRFRKPVVLYLSIAHCLVRRITNPICTRTYYSKQKYSSCAQFYR